MAGMYFEDLPVGKIINHELGRTVTETDNTLFSMLTMNLQPLHTNEDFASKTEFGRRIVNGIFTLGVVVGFVFVLTRARGTICCGRSRFSRLAERSVADNPARRTSGVPHSTCLKDISYGAGRCEVVQLRKGLWFHCPG